VLPRVILHNAVSVDGRIDWFTPDVGQFYELASRWKEDATLAGSNTIFNQEEEVPEESEGVIQPRLTHVEKLKGDIVWLRYEVAG